MKWYQQIIIDRCNPFGIQNERIIVRPWMAHILKQFGLYGILRRIRED